MGDINWQEDVIIDKDHLDIECANFSDVYMGYCKLIAEATKERDQIKDNLVVIASEIELDIRDAPEDFGLYKVTEQTIKAAVVLQKDYQSAQKNLRDSNYNLNILMGVRESLQGKRKMLEKLAELWLGSYYSEPSIKAPAKQKVRSESRKKANIKLNKQGE